jgi:hypothetical protein
MRFRLWHVPVRLATGAFILNAGLNKLRANDDEMDKHLHEMANTAYPALEGMKARDFTKALGAGEVTLGTALLTPVIGPTLAGAGLTAFSAALLGLYWRVPGMRQSGSIWPSPQGTALAKDSWLLGIGLGLLLDAGSKRRRPKKSS